MSFALRAGLATLSVALLLTAGCSGASDDDDSTISPTPGTSPTPDTSPTPPSAITSRCGDSYVSPTVASSQEGRLVILEDYPSSLLGNTRNIRIYLPADYEDAPSGSWPVLYMHDGQNLFDDSTAAFGVEWEVDENVDALVASGDMEAVIVVGVDNTPARIAEYTPTEDAGNGGGDGDLYAHFLMDELKPYIDDHFATRCEAEETAVMGSSLGGLISFYIGFHYPEVFGMAGVVSPSFWWDDAETLRALQAWTGANPEVRFWLDMGTAEDGDDSGNGLSDAVDDVRAVRDQLLEMGYTFEVDLAYQEQLDAAHNEAAWASRVHNPLLFFFGTEQAPALESIEVQPYGEQVGLTGIIRLQMAVNATYANGLELTVPNQLVTLSSEDPAIASVSSSGEVTGLLAGETEIEATYDGQSASATIEVVAELSNEVVVTFEVTVPASTPATDTVFIVGNLAQLGGWDPGAVAMTKVDATRWTVPLTFGRGESFQYKYTRGSWSSVEKDATGGEIANREGKADAAKTIEDSVVKWADSTGG